MEATAFGSAALDRRHDVALSTAIRNSAAATLSALLLFAAVFLLARRFAGGLTEPLSAVALIGVGAAAVVTAEALRLLNRQSSPASDDISTSTSQVWLPRVALPIVALAVSLPGSSVFGLAILWLMIVGEEVRQRRKWPTRRPAPASPHSTVAAPNVAADPHRRSLEQPPSADWFDPAVAQQIVYRRAADGSAAVEGWLRATFAPGQQTAIVHVAFCPPFDGVPQVESEPFDGPPCDIRPTLVLPWGVRWECKLAGPAATPGASLVLGFFATEGNSEAAR